MPDDNVWGWLCEWADYGGYADASRPRNAKPARHKEWFRTADEANAKRRELTARPGMIVTVRPSPGPSGPAQLQAPGLDLPPMEKRLT